MKITTLNLITLFVALAAPIAADCGWEVDIWTDVGCGAESGEDTATFADEVGGACNPVTGFSVPTDSISTFSGYAGWALYLYDNSDCTCNDVLLCPKLVEFGDVGTTTCTSFEGFSAFAVVGDAYCE